MLGAIFEAVPLVLVRPTCLLRQKLSTLFTAFAWPAAVRLAWIAASGVMRYLEERGVYAGLASTPRVREGAYCAVCRPVAANTWMVKLCQ